MDGEGRGRYFSGATHFAPPNERGGVGLKYSQLLLRQACLGPELRRSALERCPPWREMK